MRRTEICWTLALVLVCSLHALAGGKKDKAKPASPTVDSGSFGVYMKSQRVVTETFSIEQQNGISNIRAQLKQEGSTVAVQKSELRITSAGELIGYEWSQASGGSLSVVPNNDFLLEKVTAPTTGKTAEKPFLMPSTSAILDNNNFVQREVLIWRYLAADCKSESGAMKCQQGPVEFGALVPQDSTSVRVRVELVGSDKVSIHGTDRELLRVNLTGEDFAWALWVDAKDQFKLIRVSIPADDTEVIRD